MSTLRALWEVLTFQEICGPINALDVIIGILMWIMVLAVFVVVGICIMWLIYTIYRIIAYDYTVETLAAEVTDKDYEPAFLTLRYDPTLKKTKTIIRDATYHVDFVTEDGLDDTIDDKDLYEWADEGAEFEVEMKIGRNRHGKAKYWRVTHYAWPA